MENKILTPEAENKISHAMDELLMFSNIFTAIDPDTSLDSYTVLTAGKILSDIWLQVSNTIENLKKAE